MHVFFKSGISSKSKVYTAILFAALLCQILKHKLFFPLSNFYCSLLAYLFSEVLLIKKKETNQTHTKPKRPDFSTFCLPVASLSNWEVCPNALRPVFTAPSAEALPPKAQLHKVSQAQTGLLEVPPSLSASPSAHSSVYSSTRTAPLATTQRSGSRKASHKKLIKVNLQWNHTRCSSHGSRALKEPQTIHLVGMWLRCYRARPMEVG